LPTPARRLGAMRLQEPASLAPQGTAQSERPGMRFARGLGSPEGRPRREWLQRERSLVALAGTAAVSPEA
jgi:hypothetical protein